MKSNWLIIFAAACLPFASVAAEPSAGMPASASARTVQDFDFDWRFSKGDFPTAAMPRFDDSGWRQVNVPHDWSIEGPFSANYGSGNGYAPGGLGWYRKHFQLDDAQKAGSSRLNSTAFMITRRFGSTACLSVRGLTVIPALRMT